MKLIHLLKKFFIFLSISIFWLLILKPNGLFVKSDFDYNCYDSKDCSLNGNCLNHQCICNPGWKNFDDKVKQCQILKELPATNYAYGFQSNDSQPYYCGGGSVIHNPKTKLYHLFVSEFANCCGLNYFYPNSQIVEAVSNTPEGPFQRKRVLFPPFHYNPKVIQNPVDGIFVLYFVGMDAVDPLFNCCKSNYDQFIERPSADPTALKRIKVAYTLDLEGSWTLLNDGNPIFPPDVGLTAPSPYIFPNGTVILLFNTNSRVGSARADNWKGPYIIYRLQQIMWNLQQDVTVWRDINNNFHFLSHSLNNGVGHPGSLGWSTDGLNWSSGVVSPFNQHVLWKNGTLTSYSRRENPFVLADSTGIIKYLYSVVCLEKSICHQSFLLATQINSS